MSARQPCAGPLEMTSGSTKSASAGSQALPSAITCTAHGNITYRLTSKHAAALPSTRHPGDPEQERTTCPALSVMATATSEERARMGAVNPDNTDTDAITNWVGSLS